MLVVVYQTEAHLFSRKFPDRVEIVRISDGRLVYVSHQQFDVLPKHNNPLPPIPQFEPFTQRNPQFLSELRKRRLQYLETVVKGEKKVPRASKTSQPEIGKSGGKRGSRGSLPSVPPGTDPSLAAALLSAAQGFLSRKSKKKG